MIHIWAMCTTVGVLRYVLFMFVLFVLFCMVFVCGFICFVCLLYNVLSYICMMSIFIFCGSPRKRDDHLKGLFQIKNFNMQYKRLKGADH